MRVSRIAGSPTGLSAITSTVAPQAVEDAAAQPASGSGHSGGKITSGNTAGLNGDALHCQAMRFMKILWLPVDSLCIHCLRAFNMSISKP